MTCELIRQVRLLDPVSNTDQVADVRVVDGVIDAIAPQLAPSDDAQVREGTGLVLAPGLVDLYSHSGEPGFESRETLDSLLQAAIAGGFTRLMLLPDTEPALDHPAGLAQLRSRLVQLQRQDQHPPQPLPQVQAWGALTLGVAGQQMTELAELAAAGVAGFADGQPITNLQLLRRLLEYTQALQQPIALWCHDRDLAGNGVAREGSESIRLGLPGVLPLAETIPLSTLLECVETIGTPVHIMRVSTARSVELIQAAKAQGLPITASTTWMHLLLDTNALKSYDPNLRVEPPLGHPSDQQALRQALQTGGLDAIAVDHSPYTYEEKTVAFAEAPPGAIGLELALPLLWQTLVASGEWSALSLWRCLSTNPARCLHQNPGAIASGQVAEMVLFDPQATWTVTPQVLKSRSANTPWLGQEIQGRVLQVWQKTPSGAAY